VSASREISVYDRMCWPEGQIEQALARGAHRRELQAYFGSGDYQLLTTLAQAAQSARQRLRRRRDRASRTLQRTRIYLLPGMLGSQLGWLRPGRKPPDLLWLDPIDVTRGRLIGLRWQRGREAEAAAAAEWIRADESTAQHATADGRVRPLGLIPYTYLALKLRLTAAGFDVLMHDYDWRCDLRALARALGRRLQADSAEELVLVGHSMGGLLARAALSHCSDGRDERRIAKLVGIGTPHGGAIGVTQVLRGTYPVLLRLAAMDRERTAVRAAEALCATFRNFASLYQMLPDAASVPLAAGASPLDLFAPSSWPAQRIRPNLKLLAAARSFSSSLPPADARFISIVGTGQRTVTAIERFAGQFRYEVSTAGDGTVPAAHATLPGATNYSLRCEHSALPRSAQVAAAIVDLLLHGHTRRLRPGIYARKGRCAYVTDATLRRVLGHRLDWHRLSPAARRRYLNTLNAPPAAYQPLRSST
jgi:pimeloyl-ACP methyl ester carboxylesterase